MSCCFCGKGVMVGSAYCAACARQMKCTVCRFDNDVNVCSVCNPQPKRRSALNGTLTEVTLPTQSSIVCFTMYLDINHDIIRQIVEDELKRHESIKLTVKAKVLFTRDLEDGSVQTTTAWFYLDPTPIADLQQLNINQLGRNMNERVENFNTRGSGWLIKCFEEVVLTTTPYRAW